MNFHDFIHNFHGNIIEHSIGKPDSAMYKKILYH